MNLTHRKIMQVALTCDHRITFDSDQALGDTIKEKYESLYLVCDALERVIKTQSFGAQNFWLVTMPEISAVFEMASSGMLYRQLDKNIYHKGKVGNRWDLYADIELPPIIVMGWREDNGSSIEYGVVNMTGAWFEELDYN